MPSAPKNGTSFKGLTFGTMTEEHRLETRSSYSTSDIVFSVIVVLILAAHRTLPVDGGLTQELVEVATPVFLNFLAHFLLLHSHGATGCMSAQSPRRAWRASSSRPAHRGSWL